VARAVRLTKEITMFKSFIKDLSIALLHVAGGASIAFVILALTVGVNIQLSEEWQSKKERCEQTIPRNQQCGYTLSFAPIEE